MFASFTAHVDVVGDSLIGDGAGVADECATVGEVSGSGCNHLSQLVLHLLVGQLGLLYTIVLLQQSSDSH